jgi:HAD superfamily hydrolase (TIGR01509 family)
MMGMSSVEWSHYVRDELGVDMDPEDISREVADRVANVYRDQLPLLPGAVEAVRSLAAEWPLGLASSSNRHVIDLVLDLAGIADSFQVTVSSEEVGAGKPAPDVYLETAKRLSVDPAVCVAIEDSTNGIRSAHAAGMAVIAVPNQDFPPEPGALALADETIGALTELTPETVRSAGGLAR